MVNGLSLRGSPTGDDSRPSVTWRSTSPLPGAAPAVKGWRSQSRVTGVPERSEERTALDGHIGTRGTGGTRPVPETTGAHFLRIVDLRRFLDDCQLSPRVPVRGRRFYPRAVPGHPSCHPPLSQFPVSCLSPGRTPSGCVVVSELSPTGRANLVRRRIVFPRWVAESTEAADRADVAVAHGA